jgi:hypothetical protein
MKFLHSYLNIKNILFWTVLIFFFIFSTLPFKHGGLFRTTDDIQIVRMQVMQKELNSGQFPVRYAQELGNGGGYFIFNFYPPTTYYLAFIFLTLGIEAVKTLKIVFLLGYAFGAIGFYYFAKKFTDKVSAAVASILFLTSSYLAFDVYFRGALPEMIAFVFLPWLLLSFFKTKLQPSFSNIIISSIFYGLTMLFHTTMGVGIFPILILLLFIPPFSKKSTVFIFASLALGLFLCSFYLLPSVIEQNYTMYKNSFFVTNSYVGNFINPLQAAGLMKIPWSFETPIVGLGIYVGVCLSFFFFLRKKYSKIQNFLFIFLFLGFVIATLLAWDITKPLWANITYLRYFQFPYRFLAISTACGIILTALGISLIKNLKIKLIACLLIILPAITLQYSYLRPKNYEYVSIYTADDGCSTTTWTQEYLPLWTKECLPKKNKFPLITSSNKINDIKELQNGREISFSSNGDGGKVIVSRYFFPGWKVFADNNVINSYPSGKYGLITFNLPKGYHNVIVKLLNTPIRFLGNLISGLSVLGIIIYLIFRKTKLSQINSKKGKKRINA